MTEETQSPAVENRATGPGSQSAFCPGAGGGNRGDL